MKVLMASLFVIAMGSVASAIPAKKCLSHRQIMQELRLFSSQRAGAPLAIDENSSIYMVSTMLPAAWEDLDNSPQFRQCGLKLGPNDLRFVTTVGELAGVIMWNLNHVK